jgi:hypothetical protein
MDGASFLPHRHAHIALPSTLENSYQHPSLFIFQHSSYGTTFKCRLCETTLRQEQFALHCATHPHTGFVVQLHGMLQNPVAKRCAMTQLRLDSLPSNVLHAQVQCKMYWAFSSQSIPQKTNCIMQEAESLIMQFEAKERRCLLELAAWKAACLANPSSDSNMPNCNNYHSWQDWSRHGWKGNKKAMRDSNGIGIIVQNVSLFLE